MRVQLSYNEDRKERVSQIEIVGYLYKSDGETEVD